MALPDFPNGTGLNGSYYDNETTHFAGVANLKISYLLFYRHFMHSGSIVVLSSVTVFRAFSNMTCRTTNTSDKKITERLPCLWQMEMVPIGDFKWVDPDLKKTL